MYETYRLIVEREDRGNPKYIDHKKALLSVALGRLQRGEIKRVQYDALKWEVDNATTNAFLPYLYLISRQAVQSKASPVPVQQRASANSEEFIIKQLQEQEFEIIKARISLRGMV